MLPSSAGFSRSGARASVRARIARLVLRLGAAFAVGGCRELSQDGATACVALGACDVPPPRPEALDLLIDRSTGAPDLPTRRAQSVQVAVQFIAQRPGSLLRVWVLGEDLASTSMIREVSSPPWPRSPRLRAQHIERFVRETAAELGDALARSASAPPPHRSPIAEGVTKIAVLTDGRGLPRRLVVVTDGRQVSRVGDFECARRLPTSSQFSAALDREQLLAADSLTGMRVEFAFVEGAPIVGRRCVVNAERELRVRALWVDALQGAGASEVRIVSDAPRLDDGPRTSPSTDAGH